MRRRSQAASLPPISAGLPPISSRPAAEFQQDQSGCGWVAILRMWSIVDLCSSPESTSSAYVPP
jgi:hypothetical protein